MQSDLLSLDEAINKIKSNFQKIGNEDIFLKDALGRCLAKPIISNVDNPKYDVSSMDGYAKIGKLLSSPSIFLIAIFTNIKEQIPEETGFPGNPISGVLFIFEKSNGFPGLIAIFQNSILLSNFVKAFWIRSYFPTDTPPVVIIKSLSRAFSNIS